MEGGTTFASPGPRETANGTRTKMVRRGAAAITWQPGIQSNLEELSSWGRNRYFGQKHIKDSEKAVCFRKVYIKILTMAQVCC